MPDLLARLRQLTGAMSARQLITLGLAFVAAVGVVIGASRWLNAPDYRVLFADMEPEEAARVEADLQSQKVAYQLGSGGRDISVPQTDLDRLRLHFTSSGVPSSGRIGFEIFDRTAFGQTEFLEKVNYRRALEGELARTIASISEVQSARVHIAMAKDSLFESREQPAKASVSLKLKRNRPLAASTVSGIVNLVSASVEGLRPESVVVVDTTGRPLSRPMGGDDEPLSAALAERQQRLERDLASQVVRIIEPIVGAERVRAHVALRLDSRTEEQTEERYDPNGVIRSRQVSLEGAGANGAAGIAGARGNLPGQAAPAPAGQPVTPPGPPAPGLTAGGGSGRQSETVNYELSKTTRHSVEPRGDITRLSVAVVVDNARGVKANPDGTTARTSTPRPGPEMQKIQQLVAAAVGLDASRGDQLTVENIPFDEPIEEPTEAPTLFEKVGTGVQGWLQPAIVLVLGVVAFLFVLKPIVSGVLAARPPAPPAPVVRAETQPLPRQLPRSIEEVEGAIEAELDAKIAERVAARKTPVLARRVTTAIETEPENAARLIRAWMTPEQQS
jgi:flagellar M-ring protein FliF